MKYAGIHWPENAGGEHPNVDTILSMPGIAQGCTLICSPSARYWYRQCRGASPLVVWRAIPRQGKLPAQLGWDARKVAEECVNLWDEQQHGGTEFFQPLNELQFVREAGEPFPGYGPMAQNLARLRPALRREFSTRGQQVRLIWPPWVPTDDMDRILDWHHEAVNWDVICLVPDQRVTARAPTAGSMRHYEGEVVTIQTAEGDQLTVTPNHPILTRQGWLPAGEVNEGTEVVKYTGGDGVLGCTSPDDVDVPTPISEVFRALNQVLPHRSRRGLREDFHGDGFDSNINVVGADCQLWRPLSQHGQRFVLPSALVADTSRSRLSDAATFFGRSTAGATAIDLNGRFGNRHDSSSLFGPLLSPERLRLAGGSQRPSSPPKERLDTGGIPVETFGDLHRRFPGQVATVGVIHVNRRSYAGHVYNLTTADHLILADRIITHNCLHAYGSAETMRMRYDSYRAAFPGHQIFVGEWNSNHEGHDERASLEMWADVASADPLFLGATYFIWETRNAGEEDLSIWGNPDRLALFRDPPTVSEPEPGPEPEPEPVPPEPTMPAFPLPSWTPAYQDIFDGSIVVADEYALPRDLLLGLCYAESGDGLQSFDRWHRWTVEALGYIAAQDRAGLQAILDRCEAIPTHDISFGPCHQTWRWSDEYQMTNGQPYDLDAILAFRALYISDHGHALRVAAGRVAPFWRTYGPDKVETLSRYNKPDGTATASVRLRYANMLELARQQLGEPEPEPEPVPDPVPGETIYEPYPDPQPAGTFTAMPRGIILHGSRSGKAGNPQMSEYTGTANYEVNNTLGLGWHVTVADHRVALHLSPRDWAWHAREASKVYLGVEFAQPTVNDPITDAQVDAVADWIKAHVLPAWPNLPLHFPSHAEADLEFGSDQGKTDAFPLNDPRMDDLRARLMTRLQATEPEEPGAEYVVGPGIRDAMHAHGDRPATDEQYTSSQVSEAWGMSGSHYVYLKATNTTYRYDPAA